MTCPLRFDNDSLPMFLENPDDAWDEEIAAQQIRLEAIGQMIAHLKMNQSLIQQMPRSSTLPCRKFGSEVVDEAAAVRGMVRYLKEYPFTKH